MLFHTGRTTSGSISLHMHSSVHYRHICNDDVSSRLEGLRTRNRFEHPDSTYRDPLLDAPMTSLSTNTTYQNWHCAYCHGDLDAATTIIWDARFKCSGSYTSKPLSDETIAEHLSFNNLTSEWNLKINLSTSDMTSSKSTPGYVQRNTDNKTEIHSYCFLTFSAPAMDLITRRCYPDDVKSCSDSWEDAEVKAQCEAYTARVCSGWDTYRNWHCLLCNHLYFQEPCYFGLFGVRDGILIPSITMLLDWNRLNKGKCAPSEKYDPISRVCRKVFM